MVLDTLEKYVGSAGSSWKNVHTAIQNLQKEDSEVRYLCNQEFGSVKLLLNMFADSMLTMLAMESMDDAYISEAVEGDEGNLQILHDQIKHISHLRKVIGQMEHQYEGDVLLALTTHKTTLGLIELLLFFRYLPIKGMALLTAPEIFRNGQRNKYYRYPYFMRAKNTKKTYLALAGQIEESSFIEKFYHAYLQCLSKNDPKTSSPFRELHQNISSYEQMGVTFKNKLLDYLACLDQNISVLHTRKIWK